MNTKENPGNPTTLSQRIGKLSWKHLVGGILIVLAFASGFLLGGPFNPSASTSSLLGCGSQTGFPFCPLHFVEVMGRANVTQGTPTSIWFYSIPFWGIGQYPMVAHVTCGIVGTGQSVCSYELNLWADKVLQSDLGVNGQLHRRGETYSMSYNATIGYLTSGSTQKWCSAAPFPFTPSLLPSQNTVIQNFSC